MVQPAFLATIPAKAGAAFEALAKGHRLSDNVRIFNTCKKYL
jgi:hypothetical protein